MISAVNGYDIKYTASAKLQSEVEKFLSKGGEIKNLNNVRSVVDKDQFNSSDAPKPKGDKAIKNNQKKGKAARISKQQPLLSKYREESKDANCWKILKDEIGGVISETHLQRASIGKTSIANEGRWKLVVKAINKLLGGKDE